VWNILHYCIYCKLDIGFEMKTQLNLERNIQEIIRDFCLTIEVTYKPSHITIEFGDPSKLANKKSKLFVTIKLPRVPTNFHVECRNVFISLSWGLDERVRNCMLGPGKHTWRNLSWKIVEKVAKFLLVTLADRSRLIIYFMVALFVGSRCGLFVFISFIGQQTLLLNS
jgi:hypothetical protein